MTGSTTTSVSSLLNSFRKDRTSSICSFEPKNPVHIPSKESESSFQLSI